MAKSGTIHRRSRLVTTLGWEWRSSRVRPVAVVILGGTHDPNGSTSRFTSGGCDLFEMSGDSYRFRESMKAKTDKEPKKQKDPRTGS